jgi:hypothetical protein
MEADWEFEIAPDAPIIDAAWSGFVDLRTHPERASRLPEADQFPELAEALVRLNAPDSSLWTAKCDLWDPGEIDPDEFGAPIESTRCAVACYVDLLPANAATWSTLDSIADWSRRLCTALRAHPLRQSRADLVIRRALVDRDQAVLGVTAYLAGCAANADAAKTMLASALHAFADTICEMEQSVSTRQKLQ